MPSGDDSPIDAPARPCTTCGAGLAGAQDWCLECGSAQPGRIGGRPGWRAALTVLALTGVLATGAGAAAYAALSSEAQRQAAAPPPPAAAPQVAQVPPQTTPPATTAQTPTVEAPDSEPADVPEPSGDDAASAEDAPALAPSDDGGDGGADAGGGADDEPAEPVALDLPADAASTYDPYSRGNEQVGDPADALDGRRSTAWEAPVGPEGEVRIGLAVSLEEAQALSRLVLRADTPGFTVEVYGTRAAELPPDVLDARWKNLGSTRDAGLREKVVLDGRFRHVLLWFTAQPADTIVRIPEVQLFAP